MRTLYAIREKGTKSWCTDPISMMFADDFGVAKLFPRLPSVKGTVTKMKNQLNGTYARVWYHNTVSYIEDRTLADRYSAMDISTIALPVWRIAEFEIVECEVIVK